MKIALAGYGQEGRASYEYWSSPANQLTIADERVSIDGLPDGVTTILGPNAFSKLSDFDMIIRSPSVNPHKLPYGDKVWSATNEFFKQCPADIIGVTGTKGKGTTSSLIASILKEAGKNVHLIGNIGTPALGELSKIKADDIVVFELSSFQLWDAKTSPHVAVVLMIEPDHLDVHNDMQDYLTAKSNIGRYQSETDYIVCNSTNAFSLTAARQSRAKVIHYPFELGKLADDFKLPGVHNRDNASAAVAAVSSYVTDQEIITAGLGSFTGLPHRLKFVRDFRGVSFYDDSIATTPGSAIAALKSFDKPKLLILGGHDKGADYTELIHECRKEQARVLAIGANHSTITKLCEKIGVECITESGDMVSIVKQASLIAQPGSVVILSPAAASFDMFRSYADRGDQYIAAVHAL